MTGNCLFKLLCDALKRYPAFESFYSAKLKGLFQSKIPNPLGIWILPIKIIEKFNFEYYIPIVKLMILNKESYLS